jgi:hypothetical protein
MATSLTGATLSGSTTGSITGLQSATFGGLDVNDIEFSQAGDTNGITNHIPGTITEGPGTFTITYIKGIYNTLRTRALTRGTETWTYTKADGSTVVGTGFIKAVSSFDSDPSSEDTVTLVITPSTSWTFTAAA